MVGCLCLLQRVSLAAHTQQIKITAGLEFGLRPAMHSLLGLQPLRAAAVSGHESASSSNVADQGEPGSLDGFQVSRSSTQDVQWTDQGHSKPQRSVEGDIVYDWRSSAGALSGLDTGEEWSSTGGAPAAYYPPLVGTQIAAGTVAASAVAFNMLRGGGSGGLVRFASYCLLGGLAGSLVPSYEDSMARKYK
jgi:hypothetical protein